ncbi:50S ribosomal protein L6 [Candidatus Gottesmanbacteria bacterium]|nr:50S ribosomal protein L6 [Candidatus Gottesmanbacteria bacterium]
MSRIGKQPIVIENDIKLVYKNNQLEVVGPKGRLTLAIHPLVILSITPSEVKVSLNKRAETTALQGLYRTLIQNAVKGVKDGWTKQLELVGVGFRAQTTGSELTLSLGFSHPVIIKATEGITFAVTENKITVNGSDKYMVGEIAATIRKLKPPEPYKGKGIRYQGEHIRKKLGKAAKTVGGAGGAK